MTNCNPCPTSVTKMILLTPPLGKRRARGILEKVAYRFEGFPLKMLFLVYLTIAVLGCSTTGVPQWKGSGFLKAEFLEYQKVTVLPFEGDPTGEVTETFTFSLLERFPQLEIVEQRSTAKAFKKEDLRRDRVDRTIRAEMWERFGSEAIVLGQVFYPSILNWFLQVNIVDTETGDTLGQAHVEINYMGAEGMRKACKLIVQELKPRD